MTGSKQSEPVIRHEKAALQRLLPLTPPRKGGPTESTSGFFDQPVACRFELDKRKIYAGTVGFEALHARQGIFIQPRQRPRPGRIRPHHDVLQSSECMQRQADD